MWNERQPKLYAKLLAGEPVSSTVSDTAASGSGKTTLLRAIAGLEPFTSGQIAVDDVTLASGSPSAQTRRALCRKVGMVFQFHCLFEHMSALDNVCLVPVHAYGVAAGDAERRARELLRGFGVEHRLAALPKHLSGARPSASRSRGPLQSTRRCCSWTSRQRRSIPRAARSSAS